VNNTLKELPMLIKIEVLTSFYQDSVVLMRIAAEVRKLPGVGKVAAFMGTPSNHALLRQIGMATEDCMTAGPNDLILAVEAGDPSAAENGISEAKRLLSDRRKSVEALQEFRPRTLDSALRRMPGANLAVISVPGVYAEFEAMRALRRGLHVFLFSDNVPIEAEIELKREALSRRLFCMGPDQGTAYLNGFGLGFYNKVSSGRIGCVSASGTGLQAVASRIAALGEGFSQAIGVGGRDLSAKVGGMMTLFALEALASDSSTKAVILISKPPDPAVLPKLDAALDAMEKPVIVCCLGETGHDRKNVRWVDTLDGAADAAAAALNGRRWSPQHFSDPASIRSRLGAAHARKMHSGSAIRGLFTGGTLAYEAKLLLEPLIGPVEFNEKPAAADSLHRIIDLGDDRYTVGRPHPMIDPQKRNESIREAGTDSKIGVLLLDLVLGSGSHPNPAASLSTAVTEARAAAQGRGRDLIVLASVVGTQGDPQGIAGQTEQLRSAGIEVLPTNAEAARFAALTIRPDLCEKLLAEAS